MLFRPDNLEDLRERFECAWDKTTAVGRPDAAPGRPEGQCYATSRVLCNLIPGSRVILGSVGRLRNHCWLEMEIDHMKIVLDMAADQRGIDGDRIVWGPYLPHPEPKTRKYYKVCSDYNPRIEVEDIEAQRRFGGRAFRAYENLLARLKETSTK